jgi:hypothetical protein
MGCSWSREEDSLEPEIIVERVELSLGFRAYTSIDIDKNFRRYTDSEVITQEKLQKSLAELSMGFSEDKKSFFDHFIAEKKGSQTAFSAILVRTVGILLSKGSKTVKLRLLFEIYDISIKKKLSSEELQALIKNIIFISLRAVPEYAEHCYPNNKKLGPLVKYFQDIEEFILSFFSNIVKKEPDLRMPDLIKLFENERLRILLSPQKLRKYSIENETEMRVFYTDSQNADVATQCHISSEFPQGYTRYPYKAHKVGRKSDRGFSLPASHLK